MPMKLRDCLNAVSAKALEALESSDAATIRITVTDGSVTSLVPTSDGVLMFQLSTDSDIGQVSEIILAKEHFAELPSLQKEYMKLMAAEMEPGEMPSDLPVISEVHG